MPTIISDDDFSKMYGGGAATKLTDADFERTYGAPDSAAEAARKRLAARGLTPEMVKGGQTSVPGELREPTAMERVKSGVASLAGGVGGGLGGAVGLAADMATGAPLRYAAGQAPSPLPVTKIAGEAAADASKTFRGWMGVDPGAITDTQDAAVQAVGEAIAPMPGAKIAKGGKTVGAAADTVAAGGRAVGEYVAGQADKWANSMVNTPIKYFKFGTNPGKGIAGLKTELGGGVESVLPQLEERIVNTSSKVDGVLATPAAKTKIIDTHSVIDSEIDRSIELAKRTGAGSGGHMPTIIDRLNKLRDAQKSQIQQYADPQTAQAFKRQLGKDVRFSTDAVEGTVNETMQSVYSAFDRAIDKAVPATKSLNADLANQITAKKVLEHAGQLGMKESIGSLFNPRTYISSPYIKSRVIAQANRLRPAPGALPETIPEMPPTPDEGLGWFGDQAGKRQASVGGRPEGAIAGVPDEQLRRGIFDRAQYSSPAQGVPGGASPSGINYGSVSDDPITIAESSFPKVGKLVDGRVVRSKVPNEDSIAASFDEYDELPGVREIPMDAFDPEYRGQTLPNRVGKADDVRRTRDLAEQIRQSGEINPLIVAIDETGPYILEGGHRFDALIELGAKSLPARVVMERGANPTAFMRAKVGGMPEGDLVEWLLNMSRGQ